MRKQILLASALSAAVAVISPAYAKGPGGSIKPHMGGKGGPIAPKLTLSPKVNVNPKINVNPNISPKITANPVNIVAPTNTFTPKNTNVFTPTNKVTSTSSAYASNYASNTAFGGTGIGYGGSALAYGGAGGNASVKNVGNPTVNVAAGGGSSSSGFESFGLIFMVAAIQKNDTAPAPQQDLICEDVGNRKAWCHPGAPSYVAGPYRQPVIHNK